jgi:large subunit ribosomal protein L6
MAMPAPPVGRSGNGTMSRIGVKAVPVPAGVTATIEGQKVSVKGPKGQLDYVVNDEIRLSMGETGIKVDPIDQSPKARARWGMSRAMIANVVTGVSAGFERRLEINGVGYRAMVQGSTLQLALGYSHDVQFPSPEGIKVECPKPTEIVVSGIDKQRVGQAAANIREFRPPEPYKGKGIKYADETIVRKEGKKK